jgi:hypothetical protein
VDLLDRCRRLPVQLIRVVALQTPTDTVMAGICLSSWRA